MLAHIENFPGLYLEANEVAYLCSAGTTVGDKMVAAFDTCMTMGGNETETEMRKKPNKEWHQQ